MPVSEKDFAMYIGWDKTTPAADPVAAADPIAALAATAGTPAAEVAPVTPEVTPPVADTTIPTPTPEVTPPAWTPATDAGTPAADAGTPAADNVSWDELQKMLDSLQTTPEEAKVTTDIKTAAEDVIKASAAWDTQALKLANENLTAKVAELEAGRMKDQKTIDVIKTEYEKTLTDKISLEYWTASDSKIAQMVNEDPDVKMLIAAKLATWDGAKEKLSQARKAGRENVSWTTIDSLITAKKSAETDALWGGQDAWATAWKSTPSLYL